MIIVNQFAYVEKSGFIGSAEYIGRDSDSHIQVAVAEFDIVLIAWGKTNTYSQRQKK